MSEPATTTPTGMSVRPAAAGDLPALAMLEAASFTPAWSLDQLAEEMSSPAARLLVVEDGSAVVAYAALRCLGEEGELLRLAVAPGRRGHGLGGTLLDAAVRRLRREGIRRLFLEVRHDNLPALALYRGRGWSEVGVRRGYYADGRDALVLATAI